MTINHTPPGRFEVTMKVAVVQDDLLLVLRDAASGEGDLPGGRISTAEMLAPWAEAVSRELYEELGPDVQIALSREPVAAFPHVVAATGAPALGLLWEGRLLSGELQLSDEHAGYDWLPLDGPALRSRLSPTQADAIHRWLTTRSRAG